MEASPSDDPTGRGRSFRAVYDGFAHVICRMQLATVARAFGPCGRGGKTDRRCSASAIRKRWTHAWHRRFILRRVASSTYEIRPACRRLLPDSPEGLRLRGVLGVERAFLAA